MDITAILVLSATLCSSDAVAALTMINQETQPRLFSVLFGEGIMNDAVSIIVFEVAINLSAEQGKTNKFLFNSFILSTVKNFSYIDGLYFSLNFLEVSAFSIGIGIGMSVITTLIFKNCRFISNSVMHENVILVFMGFICWQICEILDLSGVMGLLTMGFFLSHYNFYNLSANSRTSTA